MEVSKATVAAAAADPATQPHARCCPRNPPHATVNRLTANEPVSAHAGTSDSDTSEKDSLAQVAAQMIDSHTTTKTVRGVVTKDHCVAPPRVRCVSTSGRLAIERTPTGASPRRQTTSPLSANSSFNVNCKAIANTSHPAAAMIPAIRRRTTRTWRGSLDTLQVCSRSRPAFRAKQHEAGAASPSRHAAIRASPHGVVAVRLAANVSSVNVRICRDARAHADERTGLGLLVVHQAAGSLAGWFGFDH
jgi:hypothetical protein